MPHTPPSFWRSPRLRQRMPQDEIEIPAPPQKPNPPGSLWRTLLPAILTVTVMAFLALFLSGNGQSGSNVLLFSVPLMLVSSASSVYFFFQERREYQRKIKERESKYRLYIERIAEKLEDLNKKQIDILRTENPTPTQCVDIVQRRGRRLWARTRTDDDFMVVRIGQGRRASSVRIKVPQQQNVFEPEPLIDEAQALANRHAQLSEAPLCVSMPEAGSLGLAGPRRHRLNTMRALAIQIVTHHSPDEVKLAAIFPAREKNDWDWLRWLPHTWDEAHRRRFLACDQSEARALLNDLNDLLNRREAWFQDHSGAGQVKFDTYWVVFLAAPELTENDPVWQRLQAEGPHLGVFSILLCEQFRDLPADCDFGIRVGDEHTPFFGAIRSGERTSFTPDEAPEALAQLIAESMAPLRLRRQADIGDLPTMITLMDLFRARSVEGLKVLDRWTRSETTGKSLSTPIGLRGGGAPLLFDLHERVHGPNGLVAGMVGAGKSELLQTVVASLAVNYHPHRVAFVLIDYKGGGMADPFIHIPHTLGVITNLQEGGLATRAITSLKVELNRRLRLFQEAGVNHIDKYQQLYYQGVVKEPLPYLVIIVDEFAEMKTEQPEVAAEFIRIARLGRAPGFRLILAMQKPAGIVDGQIEANTRFRLCLRVAQTEDSQAMLRRPEAAYLTGVGRAYFQVGVNEEFNLFQVAWSGAPYQPLDPEDSGREIVELTLDGRRITHDPPLAPRKSRKNQDDKERSQLQVLMNHLAQIADQAQIKPLQGPWLPPLPRQIALDTLRQGGWNGQVWEAIEEWLQPVIGLLDDPQHQAQYPLKLDLADGHLLVYGAPGYGKTTFLQTLVTSLALTYSPDDVNIYLLDLGGRLLQMFEGLPHVGAVINADDGERLHRLMRFLLTELKTRSELLGARRLATFAEYRRIAQQPLPAIVVALDNYMAFREIFDQDDYMLDGIAQLVREGSKFGIHLILTANSSADVTYRISNNVSLVATLHLVESGEYAHILGRTDGLIPDATPGRGLIKGAPVAKAFQTALPIGGDSDLERSERLNHLFDAMRVAWKGAWASPIRTLPKLVSLEEILAPLGSDADAEDILSVPLGLDVQTLSLYKVSLDAGPNFLITGPAQSGKTTFLQTWALALAHKMAPSRLGLYILDSRRMGLLGLRRLRHIRGYACESDGADTIVSQLNQILDERQAAQTQWRLRQAQGQSEEKPVAPWPTLVVMVDDFYDPTFDGTSSNFHNQTLAELARKGRGLGFHIILAGALNDLQSPCYRDPLNTIRSSQGRFMLGSSDDSLFTELGRLPSTERGRLLPQGEGYWIGVNQVQRIKLALPQTGAMSIDSWVRWLNEHHAPAQETNQATPNGDGRSECSES